MAHKIRTRIQERGGDRLENKGDKISTVLVEKDSVRNSNVRVAVTRLVIGVSMIETLLD